MWTIYKRCIWLCLPKLCEDVPGHQELAKHAIILKAKSVDHWVVILRHGWVDPFQSLHSKLCSKLSQRYKELSLYVQVIWTLSLPSNRYLLQILHEEIGFSRWRVRIMWMRTMNLAEQRTSCLVLREHKRGNGWGRNGKGEERAPVSRAIPTVGVTARRPLRGPTLKLMVVSAQPQVRMSQRDGSIPTVA